MKEEFLHFVWKYGLFTPESLTDSDGKMITVINPGEYNRDSGPDFFNSRLVIGGTEWAGNVEIHIKASDFEAHGHNRDHAFDNVILHVVSVNDRKVRNARGREVLTSEVEVERKVYDRYQSLVNDPAAIACEDEIVKSDRLSIFFWLQALAVGRLEKKSEAILKIFKDTGNDWEETLYRVINRYFGFRVNTEPFEMLAAALPFRIIKKHSDNPFQVESLLYGTAGLLEEGLFRNAIADSYYIDLIREYRILSAKYTLKPIHGWLWKFSRLRPVNFPTVRISQLSGMLCTSGGFFSRVIESGNLKDLRKLFEVSASGYWNDHYVFGKKSPRKAKKTGEMATAILLINSVIPVIFTYGSLRKEIIYTERALKYLEELEPEKNRLIDEWKRAGIEPVSAFDTQALLHLRLEYCRGRRCLECRIGQRVISKGARLKNPEETLLEP